MSGYPVLFTVHIFAGRLRSLNAAPRSRWLSAAGDVSVAHVFAHTLPDLVENQQTLLEAAGEDPAFLKTTRLPCSPAGARHLLRAARNPQGDLWARRMLAFGGVGICVMDGGAVRRYCRGGPRGALRCPSRGCHPERSQRRVARRTPEPLRGLRSRCLGLRCCPDSSVVGGDFRLSLIFPTGWSDQREARSPHPVTCSAESCLFGDRLPLAPASLGRFRDDCGCSPATMSRPPPRMRSAL